MRSSINNFLLWCQDFYWSLSRAAAAADFSEVDKQSIETTIELENRVDRLRCSWLQKKLRRTPYWAYGHLALAWTALKLNELSLSYASAQAVLVLAVVDGDRAAANWVIGKCYLRRSDYESAVTALQISKKQGQAGSAIEEDLAAAYMGRKEYLLALETLRSIAPAELSMQGQAALSFCKMRAEN